MPLEQFYKDSTATGIKVGEGLRGQVRQAIETLGNGFLDGDLIRRLQQDEGLCRDYYGEILHIIRKSDIGLANPISGFANPGNTGKPKSESAFLGSVTDFLIIYRILFLLFAEQRGMMPGPPDQPLPGGPVHDAVEDRHSGQELVDSR